MPPAFMKKKTARKKTKTASAAANTVLFLASAGILTLQAMFSVYLAAASLAVFALCLGIVWFVRTRRLSNRALSYDILHMREKIAQLSAKIALQGRDIEALQKKFRAGPVVLDRKAPKSKPAAAPKKQAAQTQPEIRPQKPPAPQSAAAKPKKFGEILAETAPAQNTPKEEPAFDALQGAIKLQDEKIRKTAAASSIPGAANDDSMTAHTALSDMVVRELVSHAVREKQIEIFLQPILKLPQRQLRFYEMYARIRARAGVYVPASRYIACLKDQSKISRIDNLLLLHCLSGLKKVRNLERMPPIFLNISPATLASGAFMRDLLSVLSRRRAMASRLIFEMPYAEFCALDADRVKILDGLAALGCRYSLDHVPETEAEPDLAFLKSRHVRFMKFRAGWMLKNTQSSKQFNAMLRLKRKMEANGIAIIAERIESEKALKELLDFDLHYGQGHLLGKPDLQSVYARKAA